MRPPAKRRKNASARAESARLAAASMRPPAKRRKNVADKVVTGGGLTVLQ